MRAWLLALPLWLSAACATSTLVPLRTVTVAQMGQAPLALDRAGDVLGVEDGSLRLRTPDGGLQRDFGGLSAKFSPSAVALSSDGRTAVGLAGGRGEVRDTASNKVLWSLTATLARFTPDGAALTLEGPNLVRRDARDGQVVWQQSLRAPASFAPVGLDGSPDGRQVAVLLGGEVTVLDSRSGLVHRRVTLPPEQDTAYQGQDILSSALAFGGDGRTVYAATARHLYRLDARSGRTPASAPLPAPVQAVVVTARGVAVAAGPDVSLLDAQTLRPALTLRGHAADVLSLAVSHDGQTLWSADLTVTKRWDLRTLASRTFGKIRAAALSPDGRTLALSLGDATLRLQDARTGAWQRTLIGFDPAPFGPGSLSGGHDPGSLRLLFSPDNHLLAAGTSQVWYGVPKARPDPGTLRVYSATSGRLVQTQENAPAYRLAFRPDSLALMASAQGLHAFQFGLDLTTPGLWGGIGTSEENVGQSVPLFVHGRPATLGVIRRADGLHAAVWTGVLYRVLEGVLAGSHVTLRGSPDGQTVAAQGPDGLRLWDVAGGKLRLALPQEAAFPEGEAPLVFSPDGRRLAGTLCPGGKPGCGSGAKLRVWDTRTGEVASTAPSWAPPVAVQEDGTVWTLEDGRLRVWQSRP